jgi:hypothetical protein
MNADHPHRVQRPLTQDELDAVQASIAAATDPDDLVNRVQWQVLTPLLRDAGISPESFDAEPPIDLRQFAIPTGQWQAILSAAIDRAGQWGAAPAVLDLINVAPATYDDPDVPVPNIPTVDYRPPVLNLRITREASDIIAGSEAHLHALAIHYGTHSDAFQTALTSWHQNLVLLLLMGLGADTHITAGDNHSLLVRTASGLIYGIVFHPDARRCSLDGCTAVIADDGTTEPATSGAPNVDHEHQPSYPLTAPPPGHWTAHS